MFIQYIDDEESEKYRAQIEKVSSGTNSALFLTLMSAEMWGSVFSAGFAGGSVVQVDMRREGFLASLRAAFRDARYAEKRSRDATQVQ